MVREKGFVLGFIGQSKNQWGETLSSKDDPGDKGGSINFFNL